MNERIKELAKQSGLWFVTQREDLIRDFAELIVQECAEIADETAPSETTYGWIIASRIEDYLSNQDV